MLDICNILSDVQYVNLACGVSDVCDGSMSVGISRSLGYCGQVPDLSEPNGKHPLGMDHQFSQEWTFFVTLGLGVHVSFPLGYWTHYRQLGRELWTVTLKGQVGNKSDGRKPSEEATKQAPTSPYLATNALSCARRNSIGAWMRCYRWFNDLPKSGYAQSTSFSPQLYT